MTGNDAPPAAGRGVPERPPYSLDLLADLHAGVLDDDIAAELRPLADADPDARATLAALEATRTALASLPAVRMPDDVAARLEDALRAEAEARAAATTAPTRVVLPPAQPSPVPPIEGARVADLGAFRRRRRALIAGTGLLAAAAAVIAVVAIGNVTGGTTPGTPATGANASDPSLPPLAVSRDGLPGVLDEALGATDYGPLSLAGRLDACLSANQLNPAATKSLGAREVIFDGRPGVLIVLPTGTAASFRMLVVAPDCAQGNPATIVNTIVGR